MIIHVCTLIYVYIYNYIHIYIYIVHVCIYIYICVCVRVCIHGLYNRMQLLPELRRYLPANLREGDYDVSYAGYIVDRDVPLGHLAETSMI